MDKKYLTVHLQIAPRTKLVQQAPFSENCLPLTIKLARKNKARILPQLDKETLKFPFEDRVLIWLHSIWHDDIAEYHQSNAKGMLDKFREDDHKLRKFDKFYHEKLKIRLKGLEQ